MLGSTTLAKAVLEIATEGVGFTKGLNDVTGQVSAFGKDLQSFGKDAKKVGEALLPFSAAIAGLGVAAVASGLDFEKSMNAIKGVLQPTGVEMDAVRQLAIKLGADTVFSAKDAADAILELGKAGLTTKESMAAVDDVLQLAAASGLSMSEAAELSARTMRAFGLQTSDLGHLNDVLAKAVNASTLEITDLQTAFGYVGPIAQGFGMSIEQTSAALAIMRDNGVAADTAGRALREGLARLANPVKSVEQVMGDLGIASFETNGKLMNLSEIVALLSDKHITAAQSLKLFGQAAGPAMFALIRQGQPALDGLTDSLKKSDGAAQAMAAAMMSGLPGAFEQLKGSIDSALIALSTALAPVLLQVLGALTSLANFVTTKVIPAFTSLPSGVQTTIVVVAGLVAALGPALIAFGAMAVAIGAALPVLATVGTAIAAFVTGPIGLIALAVAGVVLAWKNWDTITGIAKSVYEGVKAWLVDKFNAIVDSIKAKVGAVTGFFGDMYDKVVGHSFVPDMVNEVGVHFGRLDQVMVSPAKAATDAVNDMFRSALGNVRDQLVHFTSNILPQFGKETSGFMGGMMSSLNSLMSGGMNALINMGLSLAVEGAKRIGQAIAGLFKSEETKKVNKPRDQFFAQFGGGSDEDQYNHLASQLTQALIGLGDTDSGNSANRLIGTLYDADTEAKFKSAQQAIADVFQQSGHPIKMFGDGGFVLRPTLGILGEAGPEAVVPLDRMPQFGAGANATQTIILKLDGRVLTQTVVRGMPRELNLAGVAF